MKIKNTLLAFLLFLSTLTFAQNFEWVKQIKGTDLKEGDVIATDKFGNVYTAGSFKGTPDFDPGTGAFFLSATGTSSDIFIQKLDSNGNFLWAKKLGKIALGGNPSNNCPGIAVDGNGSIYVCQNIGNNGKDSSAYIYKFDNSGTLLWSKTIKGSLKINSTTLDATGNPFLTGIFQGTIDFDPNASISNLTAIGTNASFVLSLNQSGGFVWVKKIDGTSTSFANSIAIVADVAGNIYISGYFQGQVDFNPSTVLFDSKTSIGSIDMFVQKLNSTGNLVWIKQFSSNSSTGATAPKSMTIDKFDNLYIAGGFEGMVDFNPDTSSSLLLSCNNTNGQEIFIQKLDKNGNLIWANQLKQTGNQSINYCSISTIKTDSFQNIYLFGTLGDTTDFDPSTNVFELFSQLGTYNMFIEKLNTSGNFVWANKINGLGAIPSLVWQDITISNSNNIYATGYFTFSVDFDPSTGVAILSSPDSYDAFILKLNQSAPTGISENNSNTPLLLFPNPTNGNFTIDIGEAKEKTKLTVSDICGKIINETTFYEEQLLHSKIDAAAGIYFVKITSENEQRTMKIVKQ